MRSTNIIFLLIMFLSPITIKAEDNNSIAQQRILETKMDSCMNTHDYFHAMQYYTQMDTAFVHQNLSIIRKAAEMHRNRGNNALWMSHLLYIYSTKPDSITYNDIRSLYFASRNREMEDFCTLFGNKAISMNPYDSEIVTSMATYFNDTEHPDKAMELCGSYLQRDSTNLKVLRQYGYAAHLLGNATEALNTYKKLEANGFDNYESALIIGVSLIRLDSTWASRPYLRKAVERRKGNEYASLMHLGNVNIACGEYGEGVSHLEKAIDVINPDGNTMYSLLYSIAEGYYGMNNYKQAAKAFSECTKYKSEKPILYYNIAQMCKGMKDNKKELKYINMFLDKTHLLEDTPENKKLIDEMQERIEYLAKIGVK